MPTLLNQSPALLAALLLLAAFALPGPVLLRRFASDALDPSEVWIYGLPLGVVITSLVLLAIASVAGLSLVLVLSLAVVAAAVSARPLIAQFRHRKTEASSKRQGVGRFALFVAGAFIVRWAVFWATGYRFDESGLTAGNTGFWADWALHMGDVASFLHGGNFPPHHPRFIGEPHAYHYLTSITAAAMAKLGATIPFVLLLQSFVLSVFVLLGVFCFARRMSGDARVAALTLILLFLGGTVGWLLFLRNVDTAHAFWSTLFQRPWDGAEQEAANFRWQNTFFSLVQPQRSFLYGIPLGMLVLSLLEAATRIPERRLFLVAGAVAGLLPFANLSTLLALALIAPFLFLLFPVREWFFFFVAWIGLAVPQLWLQQSGGAGAASAIRTQIGWIAPPDPWIWFWLKNSGLFIPLLLFALFDRRLLPSHSRRFLGAFMPVFVIANVVVFQPWDWDNTKVLLYWYLAGCIFIAAALVSAWRTPLARGAVVLAVLTLVSSGLLANMNQLMGRERSQLLTTEELRLADEVRARTDPQSVFAVGLQHNHPVPMLSGRKVVMSYPGWLWSQGYDYSERERDLREIYALAPRAPELLTKYGVAYLVVGPWERAQFGTTPENFRGRYPTLISTPNYTVFDVRRP